MRWVFIFLFVVFSGFASQVIAEEQARKAYVATQQIKAEVLWTKARHPQFDTYRQATFRYLKLFPSLLVEEAHCIVTNEQSDVCDTTRKAMPTDVMSALPATAVQIMNEDKKGSFVPFFDEQTGLPIFEVDGVEYTALGPIGRTGIQTLLKPKDRRHATGSPSVQESGFLGGTLLGPVNTNAYGPGLHSDATGRIFTYRTQDGQQTYGPVQQDGYGLGVHTDEYGRPVYAVPE